MPLGRDESLYFGPFELQGASRTLRHEGVERPLRPKSLAVLECLACAAGRLVTKDELLRAVWPRVVVTEDSLTRCISEIRAALGAPADSVIRTMPGQGYRFLPVVSRQAPSPAAADAGAVRHDVADGALLGRDDDLVAVQTLLQQHAVVTLVGPGGVGKSSLARRLIEVAPVRPEHGVAWVDLATLPAQADVVAAVAAAVGLPVLGVEPQAALVMALRPLRLLLVLDNAEHVAPMAARLAQALVAQAPGVRLVATSQQPLGLACEQVWRLAPLAVPEADAGTAPVETFPAVALFLRRARRLDPRFRVSDADGPLLAEICRRLDGLPLALEVAAAHAPALGLVELRRALDARFDALGTARQDVPARQRTLLDAMQWSHALLAPAEQAVFRRLSVFPAGFGLELARQVVADETLDGWHVTRSLAALVERSMLEVRHERATRYRLFETARAFADQRLRAAGEADELFARHARACRQMLEAAVAAARLPGVQLDAWRAQWLAEVDNATAAMRWARDHDPETAVALAVAVSQIVSSELPRERRRVLDEAEQPLARVESPALRAAWSLEAALDRAATRTALALRNALDAEAGFRALGDPIGLYRALAIRIYCESAPEGVASAAATELCAIEDRQWAPQLLAQGANAMACWHSARGEFDAAIGWRRRNMQLHERAASVWRRLVAHSNLADSLLAAGRLDEAVAAGEELQAALRGTRYLASMPASRLNLAGALLMQGRTQPARALAEEGWPQAVQLGWQPYWADQLALLAALEGRMRASALLRGYADAGYATIDAAREVNETRAVERAAVQAAGTLGEAAFQRCRAEGRRLGDADVAGLAFADQDCA